MSVQHQIDAHTNRRLKHFSFMLEIVKTCIFTLCYRFKNCHQQIYKVKIFNIIKFTVIICGGVKNSEKSSNQTAYYSGS